MTRFTPHLIRALPLAAMIAVAGGASAHAAVPIFHCDKASLADREEEIATIRGYLPQLRDPENDIDAREEQIADYSKRLKELELGVSSCRELREFEKGPKKPRPPAKPVPTPKPTPPSEFDDPTGEEDLLAPTEDDLLAPTPKPTPKPTPSKPKPPMAPFPAPVGDPMFGGK